MQSEEVKLTQTFFGRRSRTRFYPALFVICLHGLELESDVAGIRAAEVAGTP